MSGSRKSLTSMLGGIEPAATAPPAASDAPPAEAERPSRPAPAATPAAQPAMSSVPDEQPDRQRWDQLERKDTRIHADQAAYLEQKRRELNRRRGVGNGERLTDNTLVRVALDLLRSRDADLAGATENELRRSLGLDARQL